MGCCCCCSKGADEPAQPGAPPRPQLIGQSSQGSKEVLAKKIQQAGKTGVLSLRECGLKQVPQAALGAGGNVTSAALRTVDLSVNKIPDLPTGIAGWGELQVLNIAHNCLRQLPSDLARALPRLQKLLASHNELAALPDGVGMLGLVELKCDSNKLLGLPDVFNGAIAGTLEELDVSANRLAHMPPSLCHLRSLTRLLVHGNRLEALPLRSPPDEEAGSPAGLGRLQHVNAADNRIAAISPETLRLPALSELWLRGNPIDRLVLQQVDGFEEFAQRRKQRLDQKIDQNVTGQIDLAVCGL